MRRRRTAVVLAAAVTALAGAPAAGAQVTATSTSTAPGGAATKLSWSVDGRADPVAGRLPKSVTMVARGFTLDRRAVPRGCSATLSKLDECPAKSRMGTGLLHIVVHREDGTDNEIALDFTLYQGPKKTKVFAVADFIGVRVVPGVLKATSAGLRLTFDPMPEPPPFPGFVKGYSLKEVAVDLGVTRKVTRRVNRRRRTTRHSFVRTPAECVGGAWATTVTLGYPDGASSVLDAPMTCDAGR